MGKINGCLKCLFIFFNTVFAIFGILMIFGALKASVYSNQLAAVGGPGIAWGWVFAIGVLGISCLGIYAGASEKALVFKIFAGFMGIGMIIMLIFGIIIAVTRNKIRDGFHDASSELADPLMADEGFRALLESSQETSKCCGISSATNWGNRIPESCACRSGYYSGFGQGGCMPRPQGTSGPDQIYSQTCGDLIFSYLDIIFKLTMGICFFFAVTALMGLLVSMLMIHQIQRYDGAGGPSIAMKGY